jgi:hypothetical protein
MNKGVYTFVIDIPPNFERDVLRGRRPGLQIDVDATAMVQAGLGSGYAQQIVTLRSPTSSRIPKAFRCRRSISTCGSRSTRTSRPPGSPA